MEKSSEIFERLRHSKASSLQDAARAALPGEDKPYGHFLAEDGSLGFDIVATPEEIRRISLGSKNDVIRLKPVKVGEQPLIRFALEEPSLEAIFSEFCDDVSSEITRSQADGDSPALVAVKRLDEWRGLFGTISGSAPSIQQEAGLLCELRTLLALLDQGAADAVRRWMGPVSGIQDFQFPGLSIECKATLVRNGLKVHINGSEQIQPKSDREQLIVIEKYAEDPDGPLDLKSVITEVLDSPLVDRREFFEKLSELGWPLAIWKEEYPARRFRFSDHFEFRISPDFPFLDLTKAPDRIEGISYDINLADPTNVPGFQPQNQYLVS